MIPLLAIVLTLASCVLADGSVEVTLGLSESNCVFGCVDILANQIWADAPDAIYYQLGVSDLFTTSLYACSTKYCTTEQVASGWALVTEYASEYGPSTLMPLPVALFRYHQMGGNATELDFQNGVMTGVVINTTTIPDAASFAQGLHTENAWNQAMNHHHAFGWSLYILVGAAVVIGMLNKLLHLVTSQYRSIPASTEAGSPNSRIGGLGKARTWWAKHIATPALLGRKHSEPWWWITLPTRLQSILVFIYVVINIIFTFVDYDLFDGNWYWPDKANQFARYLADRTGIMCFYNLPLLWCLAGRNDVLIFLTGWSYSTMSVFHRWVARIAAAQAIIHSASWTWIERDYIGEEFQEMYWRTGVFATVVMCVMIFPLAILPLRVRWYEIFLILHIIMALVFLVLVYFHVTVMDGAYNGWVWACVACWAFDRGLRIARVLCFSSKALVLPGSQHENTKATQGGGEAHLMRLAIRVPALFQPKPGQYFFLYQPRSIRPWENHPFTLASWSRTSSYTELHFLIAPHKGATKRIQRQLIRDGGSSSLRVLVEGPYGQTHDLRGYHRVLLIAGGSGITAILPYLYELRHCSGPRRIDVIWVVKNAAYAADVLDHELQGITTSKNLIINITLHVSREENATPSQVVEATAETTFTENTPEKNDNDKISIEGSQTGLMTEMEVKRSAEIAIQAGRPVMADVMEHSIHSLIGGEKLVVVGCGPGGMMDDLRAAVTDSYGEGEGRLSAARLSYLEEHFYW